MRHRGVVNVAGPCSGQAGWRLTGALWALLVLALLIPATPSRAAPPAPQTPPRRVALVIGISTYRQIPSLTNPKNDAALVAKSLRDDGFAVTELTDSDRLDRSQLWDAISNFHRAATGVEAAVIYYAGHGVEVGGRNYLLPSDARAATPDEIEGSGIPTSQLASAVSGANSVRLVILDACRDNPFAGQAGWNDGKRSVAETRGLVREANLPRAVVVLLATQPGLKAADGGNAANSPFARALSVALATDNLRLSALPTMVSRQMQALAGVDQSPDQQGIWDEPDWAFRGGTGAPVAMPQVAVAMAPPAPMAVQAPLQTARGYGLLLQSRNDGHPGLLVAGVDANSPFDAIVKPGDVILKLDSATPAGPQAVISAIDRNRRASISLQHDGEGYPTSTVLALPKETDE